MARSVRERISESSWRRDGRGLAVRRNRSRAARPSERTAERLKEGDDTWGRRVSGGWCGRVERSVRTERTRRRARFGPADRGAGPGIIRGGPRGRGERGLRAGPVREEERERKRGFRPRAKNNSGKSFNIYSNIDLNSDLI